MGLMHLVFTYSKGNLRKNVKHVMEMEPHDLTQDHFRTTFESWVFRQSKCVKRNGEYFEKQ